MSVVSKRATGDADIGDVYGVALEDEDEATDEEDLDRAGEVASSSSSDLPNLLALSSTSAPSANPSAVGFKYDVDEAVLRAMERGKLHEWTNVEFRAICKKHGLSMRGAKGDLMAGYGAFLAGVPGVGIVSRATGDGTFRWSNAVALHLMRKKCDLLRFELCRVSGWVRMSSLNTFGGRNKCFKNCTHEGWEPMVAQPGTHD